MLNDNDDNLNSNIVNSFAADFGRNIVQLWDWGQNTITLSIIMTTAQYSLSSRNCYF